jgi:glyceraldehyde 3-phosphate dehydrogenase
MVQKLSSPTAIVLLTMLPMMKIINELCGIKEAYITTMSPFTTDQSLHDQLHKDLRRARGASQSIVPTTTS